jgi:16S rRNA G966 N2-methylase RsmD
MIQFKIPNEYSSLYTTKNHAQQINNILLEYSDKNSIITDSTSGIGGNTFFFCNDFSFVNAVEKDANVINTLSGNLKEFNNKQIIHANYLDVMKNLNQDIIFIDPPWGGRGYREQSKVDLYLDNTNIYDIIESLYNNANIICLKAPINYNLKNSKKWNIKKYSIYKFSYVNFNIIIYKK